MARPTSGRTTLCLGPRPCMWQSSCSPCPSCTPSSRWAGREPHKCGPCQKLAVGDLSCGDSAVFGASQQHLHPWMSKHEPLLGQPGRARGAETGAAPAGAHGDDERAGNTTGRARTAALGGYLTHRHPLRAQPVPVRGGGGCRLASPGWRRTANRNQRYRWRVDEPATPLACRHRPLVQTGAPCGLAQCSCSASMCACAAPVRNSALFSILGSCSKLPFHLARERHHQQLMGLVDPRIPIDVALDAAR